MWAPSTQVVYRCGFRQNIHPNKIKNKISESFIIINSGCKVIQKKSHIFYHFTTSRGSLKVSLLPHCFKIRITTSIPYWILTKHIHMANVCHLLKESFCPQISSQSEGFYNTAKRHQRKDPHEKRKRTLWIDNKINLRKKDVISTLRWEKLLWCHILCLCRYLCIFLDLSYSITSIRRVSVAIIFSFWDTKRMFIKGHYHLF